MAALPGCRGHARTAPADELKRQNAQLADMALGASDQNQVAVELGQMITKLEAIESSMVANHGTPSVIAALKAQEDGVIAQTIALVRPTVSADGLSRLGSYISNTVKRNIKIYGQPTN